MGIGVARERQPKCPCGHGPAPPLIRRLTPALGLPGLVPGNSQRSSIGVPASQRDGRAFHHCRNRSSVSGDSMTLRSLRPLDCSTQMIFRALSICLTFSRTTARAQGKHAAYLGGPVAGLACARVVNNENDPGTFSGDQACARSSLNSPGRKVQTPTPFAVT